MQAVRGRSGRRWRYLAGPWSLGRFGGAPFSALPCSWLIRPERRGELGRPPGPNACRGAGFSRRRRMLAYRRDERPSCAVTVKLGSDATKGFNPPSTTGEQASDLRDAAVLAAIHS